MARYEFSIDGASGWLTVTDTTPPTGGNPIIATAPQAVCDIDVESIYGNNPACKVHKQHLDKSDPEFIVVDLPLNECGPVGGDFTSASWLTWVQENLGIALGTGGTPPLPPDAATETTLTAVLAVLTDLFSEQRIDFEVKCVEDGNGDIYLLRIRWDEATGSYTYDYIDEAGNVVVPVPPVKFLSPNQLLQAIVAELQTLNTVDFATETTLSAIETLITSLDGKDYATETTLGTIVTLLTSLDGKDYSQEVTQLFVRAAVEGINGKLNTLGQKLSAASAPVVLSTEQEAILDAIKTATEALDTSSLATEVTLQATNTLLTTIDAVLDAIKLDTANLDVALSTLATESTLAAIETLLTSIDGKDLATETTLAAIQSLLTGSNKTLGSVAYTDAINHATTAGKNTVMITCETGVESINGIVRPAGIYTYQPTGKDGVAAITVNANNGRIIVDEL